MYMALDHISNTTNTLFIVIVAIISVDIWPLKCNFIVMFSLLTILPRGKEIVRDVKLVVTSMSVLGFNFMTLTRSFSPLSSSAIGMAADGWMALMDRLLILPDDRSKEKEKVMENMYKLIDLYYEALDAPKKGGGKVSSVLFFSCITVCL